VYRFLKYKFGVVDLANVINFFLLRIDTSYSTLIIICDNIFTVNYITYKHLVLGKQLIISFLGTYTGLFTSNNGPYKH
jgi:hypothetical protein